MIENYKALLLKAGSEIAQTRRISEETTNSLNRQWVPTGIYNEQVNLMWNRLMPKT